MANKLDISDLRALERYFKRAPNLFKKAGVKYTNKIARELKTAIEITLSRKFEIRNDRFVFGSVRVQNMRKFNGRAIAGTIHRPRFSGFEESEEGGHKLDNAFTLNARGGQFSGISQKPARLLRGRQFYDQNTFPVHNRAKTVEKRANQILAVAHDTHYAKPFIMRGHNKISNGLFMFQSGKLQRLRKFENRPNIDHVPWMKDAIKLAQATHNPRKTWEQAIKAVGAHLYK